MFHFLNEWLVKFGQNDVASHQFQTFHIPSPLFLRAILDACNFLSAFHVDWLKTTRTMMMHVMRWLFKCFAKLQHTTECIQLTVGKNPLSILSALKGVENYESNFIFTQERKETPFLPVHLSWNASEKFLKWFTKAKHEENYLKNI